MNIEKFIPDEFSANNYVLYDTNSKDAVLFDPSGCFNKITKFLRENQLTPVAILVTHCHFDHVGDIKKYQDNFSNIKTYLPKKDKVLYENLDMQCSLFGAKKVDDFRVDEFIDENSEITFCNQKIKVIETPGHSAGSVCYLAGNILISGDTLFLEEIGRCDLITGSFSDIEKSILNKLFTLKDETIVLTGHGSETTIGHEKEFNAYFGKQAKY